jgi:hypothetical protein
LATDILCSCYNKKTKTNQQADRFHHKALL